MTGKRYYGVDYDEQYYIFDSDVIRKGRVEEEAEYSYDVFADSMSSTEIIDKLNELTNENEQLKQDRNEMFIRERDARNELRNIKKENEQLKQSNQEAIELIYDGIVEMHDGKRDYAETLFNKAIKVIKNDT